jgi:hypothetical protein
MLGGSVMRLRFAIWKTEAKLLGVVLFDALSQTNGGADRTADIPRMPPRRQGAAVLHPPTENGLLLASGHISPIAMLIKFTPPEAIR